MGGVRNTGSLLGKEELERNLPDRKIRVFVSTWNMHEEKVWLIISLVLNYVNST